MKCVDLTLIREAQAGEEKAYQKLLNIYKGRIFSYVYRIVKNYQDAEEITFETFVRCFRSIGSFDPNRPLAPYLFSIAHNIVIDFLRKKKEDYEYLDERHTAVNDLNKKYRNIEKLEKIEIALAEFAPIDREIIILFHKEACTYQEISEIVGLPVTTVKTRLHRARMRLRQLLSKEG